MPRSCASRAAFNAETYRLLVLLREFDDRMGWSKWSFRSCAEWLAWRCGMTLSAAREHVRTAQALRDMPAVSKAFAEGRLSYSKARALTRAAHLHAEASLLAYALEVTAAQLEERCRQIRNVAPESVDVARRARERRSLSVSRNPARGTVLITVEVPAEDGELIARALDRAVEQDVGHGPEQADDGWQAQQADALVAVARAYLAGGGDKPTATADHYQVVVHIDEAALRGEAVARREAGRSDLPLETVKRLSCDGTLVEIVEDAGGTPLDVGRKRRVVSGPLKRALWARDRGCSFPGCERKHYVDAHHIRHRAEGGETSLPNLTLLCAYHHALLHEGAFRIGRGTDGAIDFRRADGRVIPRGGYRLEDMTDDAAEVCKPSAEVRETPAVYRVA